MIDYESQFVAGLPRKNWKNGMATQATLTLPFTGWLEIMRRSEGSVSNANLSRI